MTPEEEKKHAENCEKFDKELVKLARKYKLQLVPKITIVNNNVYSEIGIMPMIEESNIIKPGQN